MNKKEVTGLVDKWLAAGAVSVEQADYMKADIASVIGEKSGISFITSIMYVGATALSLGFLLLIASNWEHFTKEIKLVLTVLLPIVPLSFAYWQIVVKGSKSILGGAANILGVALIGGTMALVGQIYHIDADMQTFIWLWTLLSLPFVFVFARRENVLISSVLLGAGLIYTLMDMSQKANFRSEDVIIIATLMLLTYAFILYMLGVLTRNSQKWLESSHVLRIGAGGLAVTVLFITTFEFYARAVTGSDYGTMALHWIGVSLLLNIIFILFLLFVLLKAVKHEENGFAFSIVRLFGFYLLVKYFTLFYSMLDTGLFFIIGGIMFIAGGWVLERNKQWLINYLKGKQQPTVTSPQ